MGIFSKLFGLFFGKQQMRILTVGLDNSGKTTIINYLKPKKAAALEVTPTIGFQVEEFNHKNINFTVFDMSGQEKYRNMWEHYFEDAQVIIWVIDSSDKFRMVVVKNELVAMFSHQSVRKKRVPILFFANKSDIPGSMSPVEIVKFLELDKISDRPWHIRQSCAMTGEGLNDGIAWLVEQINR